MVKRELIKLGEKAIQKYDEWTKNADKAALIRQANILLEAYAPKTNKALVATIENLTTWITDSRRQDLHAFLDAYIELLAFLQTLACGSVFSDQVTIQDLQKCFDEKVTAVVHAGVNIEWESLPLEKEEVSNLYNSLAEVMTELANQPDNKKLHQVLEIKKLKN